MDDREADVPLGRIERAQRPTCDALADAGQGIAHRHPERGTPCKLMITTITRSGS